MDWMVELKEVGLITLASLLAGVVGLEREKTGKPAGFRTHMVIGGASAMLVVCGKWLVANPAFYKAADALTFDPIRIIQAVIVGVSFIGAGTILKLKDNDQGSQVRYLTTAASLLFSAGIGMTVAVERFVTAAGVTLLILVINGIFGRIEMKRGE